VWAAGLAVSAVDAVMTGRVGNAFCAVRPPGHHATADCGMGFCILNNVAVAARHAREAHGTARVLIVDWDVHHGNGTQDIFYEDGSVLFFSTHQWPLYPGTGRRTERGTGAGAGLTINVPLAAGAGGAEVLGAMREELETAADRFRPELVLISAGFDARAGDPLGGLLLRDSDFAEMTRFWTGGIPSAGWVWRQRRMWGRWRGREWRDEVCVSSFAFEGGRGTVWLDGD
jgi:acetoin utilization deacetylase AcuC-like enzyme